MRHRISLGVLLALGVLPTQAFASEWTWNHPGMHGGNGMLDVSVLQRTGKDWAPGDWKGECSGPASNGVDRENNQLFQGFATFGIAYTNAILCTNSNALNGWTVNKFKYQVLDISNQNDQRGSWQSYGDWAVNAYKALCPDGYAVTGIAQTTNSRASKVLCSKISVTKQTSCSSVTNSVWLRSGQFSDWWGWSLNEYYGDGTYVGQDWNPGFYKASCPEDTYVAGIAAAASVRTYGILLCCH